MKKIIKSLSPLLLILAAIVSTQSAKAELKNEFGRRYLFAMEYIDFPDVLVGIVADNTNIWTRYDQYEYYIGRKSSLESRWAQALKAPLQGTIDQQIHAIHAVLSEGTNTDFRGTPIDDAGGSVNGYDRVTLEQAAAVAANPLLVADIQPDGNSPSTRLLRYRYPSVATVELARFANYLTPDLLSRIRAAKTQFPAEFTYTDSDYKVPTGGANPEFCKRRVHFCALNRELLAQILQRYAFNPNDTPTNNFQRIISTHPFDDYNGRTVRAWYRRVAGRPMFLLNFYCDIYCSQQRFAAEVAQGNREFDLIVTGMTRAEQVNPQFPDFFGIPEYWMVAAGTLQYPKDIAKFTAASKGFFNQVAVKQDIDHKLFDQVLAGFRNYAQTYNLFAQNVREAILRSIGLVASR